MNLDEILEKRVVRVRLPHWVPEAYLKINFLEDGTYGPWVFLVSPEIQRSLGIEIGSQEIFLIEAFGDDDSWEVFTGRTVFGF